jgi:hypothetical protein
LKSEFLVKEEISFFWAWEFGSYSPSAEEGSLRVSLLSTDYVPRELTALSTQHCSSDSSVL